MSFPAHWVESTVAEAGTIRLGRQRSPKDHSGPNMKPYLRVANVFERRIDISDVMEMNFSETEVETFELRRGDILLNEGQSKELVGRPAMYSDELPGVCFTNSLLRFRVGPFVTPEFSLWYFVSCMKSGTFSKIAKTTTNISHLGAERLASVAFPVPSLNEQRRIVAKLDAIFERTRAAKARLERLSGMLDQLKRAILAAAFRGDLSKEVRVSSELASPASDRGDDSAIPDSWRWARWKEVGSCQNGRAFPGDEYCDEGVRLVRPGNLYVDSTVSWTGANTKHMPEKYATEFPDYVVGGGELLMNLTAQSLKDEFLGRICMTSPGERCLLNQRIARLRPTAINDRYTLWLFKSPLVRAYIDELNTGSLIQHMFTKQINEFQLPLPPPAEQEFIAGRVTTAMTMLERLKRQINALSSRLTTLEQSALTRAFRGELVPQDPSDEPASVLLDRIRAERAAAPAPTKTRRPRTPAAPSPSPAAPAPAAPAFTLTPPAAPTARKGSAGRRRASTD